MSDAHVTHNRHFWETRADEYQDQHAAHLDASGGMAWGVWQIPESELRILGEVAGKDMLELGCGAAQWAVALARVGARPVGLDFSAGQLAHARRRARDAGVRVPLVHANAEAVPLAAASFDIVFCDHGAMTFCDPYRTVPEVARVLRPGGLLAFSHCSPIRDLCWSEEDDRVGSELHSDYFGMHRFASPETVEFQLPYGEWIRLFRANGLALEDLIEPRPAADAVSSYRSDQERDWSRRWPAECIWRARRI